MLQIAPLSAVECLTLLFQFRRCSAASFASVQESSSKVLPLFKGQRSFARPRRSSYRRLIRISDRSIAIAMALPSSLPPSAAPPVQRAQDGQHQCVGQTFSVLLSFRRHKAPLLAPLPACATTRPVSLSPAKPSSSGHRVLWLWLGFDRGVTTGGRRRRKGERERKRRAQWEREERERRARHSLTHCKLTRRCRFHFKTPEALRVPLVFGTIASHVEYVPSYLLRWRPLEAHPLLASILQRPVNIVSLVLLDYLRAIIMFCSAMKRHMPICYVLVQCRPLGRGQELHRDIQVKKSHSEKVGPLVCSSAAPQVVRVCGTARARPLEGAS